MAFPQTKSRTTWSSTSISGGFTVPISGASSGELILVEVCVAGSFPLSSTTAVAAGWTELSARNPASTHATIILYKESDGTETNVTIDRGLSGTIRGVAIVSVFQDWDSIEGTFNGDTLSSTPNPGSHTASGGSADNLWISSIYYADDNGTVTAYPTDYTNGIQIGEGGTNNSVSIGSCERELATATEDPTAFTLSELERFYWGTMVIAPGAKGPSGSGATYTLDLDGGSYTLSGGDLALSGNKTLALDAGSFNLTGGDNTLVYTAGTMTAQSDNFDSAIGTSVVTNATTSTPDVTITPDDQGDVSEWLATYTRYSGCNGKTAVFTLDFTSFREDEGPDDPDWQMIWRYVDDTDPATGRIRPWNTFDNGTGANTGASYIHTFSNNTAFTQDEVEVAVKPRWRYLDTQHAIAYAAASAYGEELPSSVAATGLPAHVHDTITVTSGSNSAAGATLNLYGVLLDDTSVSPTGSFDKLNIVVIPGQHASEDQGSLLGWETAKRYIDATGTEADWFRQHCRLFVYDANPSGRYYGRERFTTEDGGNEDPNRAWDDTGSEQVTAVIAAIETDLADYGNRMDVMWDCHGAYSLNGNPRTVEFGTYDNGTTAESNYRTREGAALVAAETSDAQGATFITRFGPNPTGSAGDYANAVWAAQLGMTPENPIAARGFPDSEAMYYDRRANWFVTALNAMVDNSELTLTSTAVNLSLEAGSFSLTGGAIALPTSRNLSLETGSFATTGGVVDLPVSRALALESGSISLTGGDIGFVLSAATYNLSLDAGSYTLTGGVLGIVPPFQPIQFELEAGAFNLSGGAITFGLQGISRLVFASKNGADTVDVTQLAGGELAINLTYGKLYTRDNFYNVYTVGGLYNGQDLPRSDPQTLGAFWNDNGILKVSAG